MPCALVSASYRVLLDAALTRLPADTFAFSVAGDEVTQGKPHPEPYERACTRARGRRPRAAWSSRTPIRVPAPGNAAGALVIAVPNRVDIPPAPRRRTRRVTDRARRDRGRRAAGAAPMRRTSRLAAGSLALGARWLLAPGRLPDHRSSRPTPTPAAPPPRPFTVMSTDPIRVTDPAAITDAASACVSLNVFQRLMTADPGQSVLKPDAARDCLFTSATTYTCTLNEELAFHNGHPLTSSDVKFSIQRATRLNVPGSSHLAAVLAAPDRDPRRQDRPVRAQPGRHPVRLGPGLAGGLDRRRGGLRRRRDPPPKASDRRLGPVRRWSSSPTTQLHAEPRTRTYVGRNPARIPDTGLSHRPRLGDASRTR